MHDYMKCYEPQCLACEEEQEASEQDRQYEKQEAWEAIETMQELKDFLRDYEIVKGVW